MIVTKASRDFSTSLVSCRALSSPRALVKLARMTPGSHDITSLDYYNIEELLTDEERAARDRARRFVQEEVMSEIVPCHRAGKFPEHLIPRMGALGFYAPYLKGHGRTGVRYTAYGLIMQELERADSGLRSLASVQGPLVFSAVVSGVLTQPGTTALTR